MLTYGSMSGYDMKKMSDHSIGHFWNENYGNIYPVLKKLESEELVSMERQEQDGAPDRKVYTITESGREEFSAWMNRMPEPTKLREELLLQIFFGQWFPPEMILEKLRAEEERCHAVIAELEGILAHMERNEAAESADAPKQREIMMNGTPYWKSTVLFGLNHYRAILQSCRDIAGELNGEAGTK
jgi:DNA-binding PadR family transcriptional regulator